VGEKVDEAASIDERQIMRNSGKLLIFGILTVAVLLAGASWWFRYIATHRAARFWGPEAVRLIRDARRTFVDLTDAIAGYRPPWAHLATRCWKIAASIGRRQNAPTPSRAVSCFVKRGRAAVPLTLIFRRT
jgi:hypothetical protein